MTLAFDSVYLEFGLRPVLTGVYMKCETGKITGLLGRNGSGKSCLMKIVFGSMKASHQSIRIGDVALPEDHLACRLIAYLPQEKLIPPFLTIGEAMKLFGISRDEVSSLFPEAHAFFDLRASQLSGGYLRIIETLMILKSKAPFCILDEPFSGLMPLHIEKLKEILLGMKASKGIILTDHLHQHVASVSDSIYLLNNGKTYPVTDPQQLVSHGYLTAL